MTAYLGSRMVMTEKTTLNCCDRRLSVNTDCDIPRTGHTLPSVSKRIYTNVTTIEENFTQHSTQPVRTPLTSEPTNNKK